jgi:hypothetical protein
MTYLDIPAPFHLTREGRAIRARIVRIARSPSVERAVAVVIFFSLGFAAAGQL